MLLKWKYGHNMWKYMELQLCFTGNLDLIWDLYQTRLPQAICSGQGEPPAGSFDLLIYSPRRQSLANCMLWSG